MIANLQMYLWQPCLCFYPGLNLQSQFNLDNITVFNKNEQESTLGQKVKILPLDLDSKHFMCCFFKNVIFPTSMFTADRWKGRHHGGGGRWNGGGWRTCALVSGRLALWDCSFSNHLKKLVWSVVIKPNCFCFSVLSQLITTYTESSGCCRTTSEIRCSATTNSHGWHSLR